MSPPGPSDRTVVPTSEAPQIGGYTVLRLIGHGGAGRVFAARDEALGRTVAIKVLHPQVANDPKNVERFLREARAMATISSPHVASIYQVGQHRKVPFIVMEYLEGQNLEQRLQKDGRIPVEEALIYVRDGALALKAADAAGIVHRDVKPANILVIDGRAKLTDFGTARPVDGSADMTVEGQIAGTATFMAPERVTGKGDDRRADIYSLGATLYCLISGEPPFVRASPIDVIAAHLREEPVPLEQQAPGVSPLVGGVVKRMMAKDPARRFQSYDELIKALEAILRGGPRSLGPEGFDEQTEDLGAAGRTLPSPSYADVDPNDPFAAPPPSFAGPPGTGAMVGEPTGVMGTLKQMSIVDICHMLEMGKKDAEIELTAIEGISGELCFLGGQVVYCVWGDDVAERAFYRLARRNEGFFRIHYGRRTTKKNIDVPTAFLVLEAMRRLDEQERGGASEERHADVALDDDVGATTDRPAAHAAHTTLPVGQPVSLTSGDIEPLLDEDALSPPPAAPPSPFEPPAPPVAPRPAMAAPRRTSSTPRARPVAGPPLEALAPSAWPSPPPPSTSSSSRAAPPAPARPVAAASAPTLLRDDTVLLSPAEEAALRAGEGRGVPLGQRLEPVVDKVKGLRRLLWQHTVSPALGGANTQLAGVTVRLLERSSALTPVARQVRARPWLPLAALCAGCFAVAFTVVALLAVAPASQLSLARIDGGEAAAVLAEIEAVPPLERTAKQELYRAHALARLGRTQDALKAYRAAGKLGLADERGLTLALAALEQPNPVAAMDLLVEYPREEANEALLERVRDESWVTRHNALLVLDERGAKGRVDLEALAIQDVLTGPTCKQRRLGLVDLKAHGKSEKAREAFKKAYALKDGDNACMRADLDAMAPR